jgi:hypothetical protein
MMKHYLLALAILAAPASAPARDAGMPSPGFDVTPAVPVAFDDTAYSFPLPGRWATGLCIDGDDLWIQDNDSNKIFKIDTTGQILRTLESPGGTSRGSGDLEIVNGALWAISENDARLYQLDMASGAILKSFALPDSGASDPSSWGLVWDGAHFWHTDYSYPCTIFELDTADGSVIRSFPAPGNLPIGIAWDGEYLWCVNAHSATVNVIDTADGSTIATRAWPVPYALGTKWDGRGFWCVSGATRHGGTNRGYRMNGYSAVAEPAPPAPGRVTGATIARAAAVGRLFDPCGRRVNSPRTGVHFLCEPAGDAVRPVVIVR